MTCIKNKWKVWTNIESMNGDSKCWTYMCRKELHNTSRLPASADSFMWRLPAPQSRMWKALCVDIFPKSFSSGAEHPLLAQFPGLGLPHGSFLHAECRRPRFYIKCQAWELSPVTCTSLSSSSLLGEVKKGFLALILFLFSFFISHQYKKWQTSPSTAHKIFP